MSCNQIRKQKPRDSALKLTVEDIDSFIAHSDDERESTHNNSSGSDWDDIGEADLSAFVSNTTHLVSNREELLLDSEPPSTSLSLKPNKRIIKDVGLDPLFQTITSNSNDKVKSPAKKFTSSNLLSENDSEDNEELEGLDEDIDRSLSEHGASIQRKLSVLERIKKDKLIDHAVNQSIQSTETTQSSMKCSSISLALAACASRRQKAINDLNAAVFPISSASKKNEATFPSVLVPNSSKSSELHSTGSNSADFWVAVPTKLRVYRPRISSELWTNRTSDRLVLNLAQFLHRCRTQNSYHATSNTAEAVVVGVIGSKLAPRRSKNDRIYSVWCLSDLESIGPGSSGGCLKLFLFGKCHDHLWKESEGSVIAVLNPHIMSSNSSFSDEKDVGITSDSPLHVMILGESPDYGICAATTKSGQCCFHVINKSLCRYCDYHVKKAYYEASSTRPGFLDSSLPSFRKLCSSKHSGNHPSLPRESGVYGIDRNLVNSAGKLTESGNRVKLSVAKLDAAGFEVDASTGLCAKKTISTSDSVCHLAKQTITDNSVNKSNVQLKDKKLNKAEDKLVTVLRRPSAGSLNLLRHLKQEVEIDSSESLSSEQNDELSRKKLTEMKKNNLKESLSNNNTTNSSSVGTFAQFFSSMSKQRKSNNLNQSICTSNENFIDLGPVPQNVQYSSTRLRATELVKSQGGIKKMIEKENIKRKSNFCSTVDSDVRCTNTELSPLAQILDCDNQFTSSSKRPRLSTLDGLCKSSITVSKDSPQNVIKQKRLEKLANLAEKIKEGSAHKNLVQELEVFTEQSKLDSLEKRDEFEQKLLSKQEEPCTYVRCLTCGYRSFKAAPDCQTNNHTIKYLKGVKRYFRCRHCQKRTITLERYPVKSCSNCGESLFEKTGILAERKGPNLPHEQLLPRGLEEKFFN